MHDKKLIAALQLEIAALRKALDGVAEARPWAALKYAAAYLTPARLDACAEAEPWTALIYVPALLTPERLDACKKAG